MGYAKSRGSGHHGVCKAVNDVIEAFHLLNISCSLPVILSFVCVVMETVFTQVILEVK